MTLLDTTLKITTVLLVALAALALMRKRSAATRHWLLAVAVGCGLLVPALAAIVPSWSVPSVRLVEPPVESRIAFNMPAAPPSGAPAPLEPGLSATGMIDISLDSVLIAVWAAGATLALALLALSLARLHAIAAAARPVVGGTWTAIAGEIAGEYGLRRRVRLLCGDHPAMLATWGLATPTVILPQAAHAWPDDRLRVVLRHELAHIRRGDWGVQLAADVLRALQWFNPLAWLVCRRLRLESEHACDDHVLAAGVGGPDYATHLLDLARAYSARRVAWSLAMSVARPSGLERRVRAMLNARLNRDPLTERARLATAIAFLVLAGGLAGGALFAQGPFATVAGSIADPLRGALPNATLVMTNTTSRAKNEVRSDGTGRYEFVGLPPGDYVLEVSVPGFRAYRAVLSLDGQQVDRDIVMAVAGLQETIIVADDDAPPRVRSAEEIAALERRRLERAAARCPAGGWPGQTGGVPIGGNLRPPAKLRDVRPEYPAELKAAKVGGVVNIETRIAADGTVGEMQADQSAHPDLARAAMAAVREWRFDETLLNCVPVEVSMTVQVTFKPRE